MTGPVDDHSGMMGLTGMTGMTGMTGSSVNHSGMSTQVASNLGPMDIMMTGQIVNNSGMIRPGLADLVRPGPGDLVRPQPNLVRPGPTVDHPGRTCPVDHSGGRRARRRTDPTPNKDNKQQQNRQIQSYWRRMLKI